MTIGPNEHFERCVAYLLEGKMRTSPGLELVSLSRVTNDTFLAFGNKPANLAANKIKRIGKTKACIERRAFVEQLKEQAMITQQRTKELITDQDTSDNKTYEGGCNTLLQWFDNTVASRVPIINENLHNNAIRMGGELD